MSDPKIKVYEDKMKKAIEFLESDLQTVRAGRANPHILDHVRVDYYGAPTPLQQVANVSVPEARIIQIQPWDKNLIKDICRAIQMADIGINPTSDATMIRLVFPEMTEENRKNLAKDVKKKGEDSKVVIRAARRDGMDDFKKQKKAAEISEDVESQLEDELQKLTDEFIKKVDSIVENKTAEVMKV
jgi:ribosome recycling factor